MDRTRTTSQPIVKLTYLELTRIRAEVLYLALSDYAFNRKATLSTGAKIAIQEMNTELEAFLKGSRND
jgi:hypothetical protein